MNTEGPIVPVAGSQDETSLGSFPAPEQGGRRLRLAGVLAGIGIFALTCLLWFAFSYKLDYVLLKPGSARPTSGLVAVEGVETFAPTSEINYTTVALRTTVTPWEAVRGWLNDDVEVLKRELIIPDDQSADENRQQNLQLMDTSKLDAIRVALLELGYEVPISIDGTVITQVLAESNLVGEVERGETIVAIEGETIDEPEDVTRLMSGRGPGTTVTLSVENAARTDVRDVVVALIGVPDDPERGLIGVELTPRSPEYDFPFEVDIDSGDVGGPSAGLAFTLAVIDALSPGDLTGGVDIAVTGTIDGVGRVGPIGGVEQKAAAVRDRNIAVFLVPTANFDAAFAKAGDEVQIIAVSTLAEALAALQSLGGSGIALGNEGGPTG